MMQRSLRNKNDFFEDLWCVRGLKYELFICTPNVIFLWLFPFLDQMEFGIVITFKTFQVRKIKSGISLKPDRHCYWLYSSAFQATAEPPYPHPHTFTTHWTLSGVDIFRSLVDDLNRSTAEVQSWLYVCLCETERGRETGKACECNRTFINHAVAYSVWQLERELGPGDVPLALRKLSLWDASASEQPSLGGLPC